MTAVRFIESGEDWFIEGLALPFGGPVSGNDLTGTRFVKDTDLCLEWFPDGGRPLLYAHGFDQALGTSVVGREVKSWEDDKGRWMRAQIDRRHEYAAEIRQLVEDGHLSLSSGAVDHLVRIAKDGTIKRWPWVEESLVPNPANPEAVAYSVRSADVLAHLAVTAPRSPAVAIVGAKDSEAAIDATQAAYLLASLLVLYGDETDEAQGALLRTAIDAVQAYIAAEVAEVGSPEDVAESEMEMADAYLSVRQWRRTQSTLLTEPEGEAPDAPPARLLAIAGKDVEPVTDADLAALRASLSGLAVRTAQELLRR